MNYHDHVQTPLTTNYYGHEFSAKRDNRIMEIFRQTHSIIKTNPII